MKKVLFVAALLVAGSACSSSETYVRKDNGTCVKKHSDRVLGVKLNTDEKTVNIWGENFVCPGEQETPNDHIKGKIHKS